MVVIGGRSGQWGLGGSGCWILRDGEGGEVWVIGLRRGLGDEVQGIWVMGFRGVWVMGCRGSRYWGARGLVQGGGCRRVVAGGSG